MSNKKLSTTKKGFTIIEVVLVLAIAGLIFLMVFVALPALQRNQRDTQRRQDYSDLAAAVIGSATSNNGKPLGADRSSSGTGTSAPYSLAANQYVNKTGKDPQGVDYDVKAAKLTGTPANVTTLNSNKYQVWVYYKTKCSNGSPTTAGANEKDFTIYGRLETGTYCGEYSY